MSTSITNDTQRTANAMSPVEIDSMLSTYDTRGTGAWLETEKAALRQSIVRQIGADPNKVTLDSLDTQFGLTPGSAIYSDGPMHGRFITGTMTVALPEGRRVVLEKVKIPYPLDSKSPVKFDSGLYALRGGELFDYARQTANCYGTDAASQKVGFSTRIENDTLAQTNRSREACDKVDAIQNLALASRDNKLCIDEGRLPSPVFAACQNVQHWISGLELPSDTRLTELDHVLASRSREIAQQIASPFLRGLVSSSTPGSAEEADGMARFRTLVRQAVPYGDLRDAIAMCAMKAITEEDLQAEKLMSADRPEADRLGALDALKRAKRIEELTGTKYEGLRTIDALDSLRSRRLI